MITTFYSSEKLKRIVKLKKFYDGFTDEILSMNPIGQNVIGPIFIRIDEDNQRTLLPIRYIIEEELQKRYKDKNGKETSRNQR